MSLLDLLRRALGTVHAQQSQQEKAIARRRKEAEQEAQRCLDNGFKVAVISSIGCCPVCDRLDEENEEIEIGSERWHEINPPVPGCESKDPFGCTCTWINLMRP